MDSHYDSYRYSFESCKTFKDGSVNPTDFASICRRYKLNYKSVMDEIGTNGEGRYSLEAFIHFMKRYQQQYHPQHPQHQHHPSYGYEPENFGRPMSPHHRPSSGNKFQHPSRQVHSSASSHHHHTRHVTRYPMSPTTAAPSGGVPFNEQDNDFTPAELDVKRMRTPEFILSPDEKLSTKPGHERDRHLRQPDLDHTYPHDHYTTASTRSRGGALSRATIDSPPPSHMTRRVLRGDMVAGRSDKARSYKGDNESGDDDNPGSFYPPPAPTSRSSSCKRCKALHRQIAEMQEDLKATRNERERLELNNERLRKDMAQNTDHPYAQLYRENEKLRKELTRLKKESMDPDPDRTTYLDRQYEELKKAKNDLEEDVIRERTAHKSYKKDCAALKAEYNNIKLRNEELQRANWRLKDDNHKLTVKLMDDDKSSQFSRRPGDGGSEENSARSSYASGDHPFPRNSAGRQSYHLGSGRGDVTRESSRSRKGHLDIKRTSSEGKALDHDEPVKENAGYSFTRAAKSHKSATSDAGSVGDFTLTLVSTTPDEQSQVFMVLGEDVSKSVLPEGLPKDKELAMMYALQNCHSVQELIKCLVSYGVSTSSDKLQGFQVENEHLKKCVEHLKQRQATLNLSFESAKANMESMYHTAQKVEANNMRLRHAIKLCRLACEVFEVLIELRMSESRNPSSSVYEYDYSNSPDREPVLLKHSAPYRARSLLHTLDANTELQQFLPLVTKIRQITSAEYPAYTSHWPNNSSQNTGTTSGLSSLSGGVETEITQSDIDRLKHYTQALRQYENHLVTTLITVDGLKSLDTVKKGEMLKDCQLTEQGSSRGDIVDLEDAAHAEELCKVREEKAELRSQIYMMEQEKRRMELEVSRMLIHKQKCDKQLEEFRFLLEREKKKRKRERKTRKGDPSTSSHDPNHMSELSIDYTSALEREKELTRRYEILFDFLQHHVKDSQDTTEDLMRFVKELRQANSALVDAFEKSKKRQQAEKRRMKQELVSYMNRVQDSGGPADVHEPPNGPIYA